MNIASKPNMTVPQIIQYLTYKQKKPNQQINYNNLISSLQLINSNLLKHQGIAAKYIRILTQINGGLPLTAEQCQTNNKGLSMLIGFYKQCSKDIMNYYNNQKQLQKLYFWQVMKHYVKSTQEANNQKQMLKKLQQQKSAKQLALYTPGKVGKQINDKLGRAIQQLQMNIINNRYKQEYQKNKIKITKNNNLPQNILSKTQKQYDNWQQVYRYLYWIFHQTQNNEPDGTTRAQKCRWLCGEVNVKITGMVNYFQQKLGQQKSRYCYNLNLLFQKVKEWEQAVNQSVLELMESQPGVKQKDNKRNSAIISQFKKKKIDLTITKKNQKSISGQQIKVSPKLQQKKQQQMQKVFGVASQIKKQQSEQQIIKKQQQENIKKLEQEISKLKQQAQQMSQENQQLLRSQKENENKIAKLSTKLKDYQNKMEQLDKNLQNEIKKSSKLKQIDQFREKCSKFFNKNDKKMTLVDIHNNVEQLLQNFNKIQQQYVSFVDKLIKLIQSRSVLTEWKDQQQVMSLQKKKQLIVNSIDTNRKQSDSDQFQILGSVKGTGNNTSQPINQSKQEQMQKEIQQKNENIKNLEDEIKQLKQKLQSIQKRQKQQSIQKDTHNKQQQQLVKTIDSYKQQVALLKAQIDQNIKQKDKYNSLNTENQKLKQQNNTNQINIQNYKVIQYEHNGIKKLIQQIWSQIKPQKSQNDNKQAKIQLTLKLKDIKNALSNKNQSISISMQNKSMQPSKIQESDKTKTRSQIEQDSKTESLKDKVKQVIALKDKVDRYQKNIKLLKLQNQELKANLPKQNEGKNNTRGHSAPKNDKTNNFSQSNTKMFQVGRKNPFDLPMCIVDSKKSDIKNNIINNGQNKNNEQIEALKRDIDIVKKQLRQKVELLQTQKNKINQFQQQNKQLNQNNQKLQRQNQDLQKKLAQVAPTNPIEPVIKKQQSSQNQTQQKLNKQKILAQIQQKKLQLQTITKNIQSKKSEQAQINQRQTKFRQKIVSLQKQLKIKQQSIKKTQQKLKQLLLQKQKLQNQNSKISVDDQLQPPTQLKKIKTGQIQKKNPEPPLSKQELKKIKDQLQRTKQAIRFLSGNKLALEKQQKAVQTKVKSLEQKVKKLNSSIKQLQDKQTKLKEQCVSAQQVLKTIAESENKKQTIQQSIKKLKYQEQTLIDDVSSRQKQKKQLENQLSNTKTLIQKQAVQKQRLQKIKKQYDQKQKQIQINKQKIKSLELSATEYDKKIQKSKKQLQQLEQKSKKQKDKLDSDLQQKQKLLKSLQTKTSDTITSNSQSAIYFSLFIGDCLQSPQDRHFIITTLQSTMHKQIKKTRLLFNYPLMKGLNPHSIVDGIPNYIILLRMKGVYSKTGQNFTIGLFSQRELRKEAGFNTGRGFLCSISRQEVFYLSQNKNLNPRVTEYDQFYFVFGNSEVRFKINSPYLETNIGHNFKSFQTGLYKDGEVFTGTKQEKSEILCYEIFQVLFD